MSMPSFQPNTPACCAWCWGCLPLLLPADPAAASLAEIEDSTAVALFVDRLVSSLDALGSGAVDLSGKSNATGAIAPPTPPTSTVSPA